MKICAESLPGKPRGMLMLRKVFSILVLCIVCTAFADGQDEKMNYIRHHGGCERCALTWWSSLQQNDVAVFNPLKTLISKESADFVLSRRVFAKGCSGGVHDFMNTGCSGCSRGCSRSSVHPVCSLSSRFFLLTRR